MEELHPDLERVLFSESDIRARVREMGAAITRDYAGKDLVVISILRGAAIFMADLVRQIDLPLEMDFMAVSSYGKEAESSGIVRIQKDLSTDIMGRDVLIAEDVIDTGLTLRYLIKNLQSRKPASLSLRRFSVRTFQNRPIFPAITWGSLVRMNRGRLWARLRGKISQPSLCGSAQAERDRKEGLIVND